MRGLDYRIVNKVMCPLEDGHLDVQKYDDLDAQK